MYHIAGEGAGAYTAAMDKKHFARADGAAKGRGATGQPHGRFEVLHRARTEDGWDSPPPPDGAAPPPTTVHWEESRSILSENHSPDIPHTLSANPYRGCEHGCVYCFARPMHAYLGLSPGLDFETKLFAKRNAAALLRQELAHPSYRPQPLSLGIVTDAYQPIERKLRITREMLEVLAECRHPVSLITKSALIERDTDLLAQMAQQGLAEVAVSITSLDNDLTRRLEARAAAPQRRLKIIENLAAAGIPVTVLMAPVIPALNDGEIESVLTAAARAGAVGAGYVVLRLPHELKEVFRQWLHTHMPLRAEKVMAQVMALHGGKDYDAQFFTRHRGRGVFATLIAQRFARARKQCGLESRRSQSLRCDLFRPPSRQAQPGQGMLDF